MSGGRDDGRGGNGGGDAADQPSPYLWDRSGDVDPEVAALEARLAPLRASSPLPPAALPDRPPARPRPRRALVPLLAVAVAAAAGGVFLVRWRSRGPTNTVCQSGAGGLRFSALAGRPSCDGAVAGAAGLLGQGKWMETDPSTRVRLEIADLGHVEIDGGSRVRVLEASAGATAGAHRLELGRGRLQAAISAPPRLFFVSTRAATAVDLGCAYELAVGDDGGGTLRVTSGYVELEATSAPAPRRSLVPRGAECAIDPSRGPGTPVWSDAPEALRAAVRRWDEEGTEAAMTAALGALRASDSLTALHLLQQAPPAKRLDLLNWLESTTRPAPAGAPRARTLAGAPEAFDAWRAALQPIWSSRGPVPGGKSP